MSENKFIIDKKSLKTLKIEYSIENKIPKKTKRLIVKRIIKLKEVINSMNKENTERKSLLKVYYNEKDKLKAEKQILKLTLKSHNVSTYFYLNSNLNPKTFSNRKEAYKWALGRLKEKIVDNRSKAKEKKVDIKRFKGYNFCLTGLVNIVERTVLDCHKNYRTVLLDRQKYPDNHHNYVGVEIEFFTDYGYNYIKKQFLKNGLYNHVHIKGDSSIEWDESDCDSAGFEYDDTEGFEITVLMKENELEKVLKDVCKALSRINAETNDTCGLHVHLDMRNKDYKKVFYNLAQMQDYLYKMVDSDRASNTFCEKVNTSIWDDSSRHHYTGINGKDAYSKFETIEIRMHQGTTVYKEINNWVMFLLKVSNYRSMYDVKESRQLTGECFKSFAQIKEDYKLDDNLFNYYNNIIGA